MTTTINFTEEEHVEAIRALNATKMVVAARNFDEALRDRLKHGELLGVTYSTTEELRALHRQCWLDVGITWEDD